MPTSQPNSGLRRPRRAVTGRAIVLATVVVLLLVVLASPLNRYFASRHDVAKTAAQLHADSARLAQLKAEQLQWGDFGYIQAQARLRLQYAMPGDTTYVVVDHGAANEIDKTATVTAKQAPAGGWNAKLWDSVTRASGTS
jgi:cell division protein FtsB